MVKVNLLQFAYAGGSAGIFKSWNRFLPDWIRPVPIELPGRGAHLHLESLVEWQSLIAYICDATSPFTTSPFAIFGHSLGALIGFELAQTFADSGQRKPVRLIVSACKAPARQEQDLRWLQTTIDEMRTELSSLNGTPVEILDNTELLELLFPALRADFHLRGSYRKQTRPPLNIPISVLIGTCDGISKPIQNMMAWMEETLDECSFSSIQGDHFFLNKRPEKVVEIITKSLAGDVR